MIKKSMSGFVFILICVGKPAPPIPAIPESAIFVIISCLLSLVKSWQISRGCQVSSKSTSRNIHSSLKPDGCAMTDFLIALIIPLVGACIGTAIGLVLCVKGCPFNTLSPTVTNKSP